MSDFALFCCCTDLHLSTKVPSCRSDDFVQTQLFKLNQLLTVAEHQTKMKLVLCAGDFFDSATRNMDYTMLARLIALFNAHRSVRFITVAGNHDMRFHTNDLMNTPLNILATACENFQIATALITDIITDDVVLHIHSANWGENLEDLARVHQLSGTDFHKDKEHLWVGLTHRTVFEKTVAPWAETTGITAKVLIELCNESQDNHKFDYIITGDNHETFVVEHDGTTLINAGPMLRTSIDKIDFQPHFARVWKDKVSLAKFPIVHSDHSFDHNYVAQQKELKEATKIDFDNLLTEVNNAVGITNDFRKAIKLVVTQKHPELLEKLEKIINS